jgi:hypothetical protein
MTESVSNRVLAGVVKAVVVRKSGIGEIRELGHVDHP